MKRIEQVGLIGAIAALSSVPTQAQIVPDDTLGDERSQLTSTRDRDLITNGAKRGQNLFHSFEQFNIDENRGAYFVVPDSAIQNVLTRITGKDASRLSGTLGTMQIVNGTPVSSSATLFFINPNGILFGENSRLDLGGSFVATTAQGIQFGALGSFDAVNPTSPSPLLTIQPSAFLFSQLKAGSIENNSIALAGEDQIGQPTFGLSVNDGKTLTLLGGNIQLQGGNLTALDGQIHLAAIAGEGVVSLNPDGSLNLPSSISRADIILTNGAIINTAANYGGSISLNARNIKVINGSSIKSGILPELGEMGVQSGTIALDATGFVQVQNSEIINSTFGKGNAGTIRIRASDRILIEGAGTGNTELLRVIPIIPAIRSRGEIGSIGNAGNIEITTNALSMLDNAGLSVSNIGQGNSGNIEAAIAGHMSLDASGFISLSKLGQQNGNIRINTQSLSMTSGSRLATNVSSEGQGARAGSVIITATGYISIDGTLPNPQNENLITTIFSGVEAGGAGQGGEIRLSAPSIAITNGAAVISATLGNGNAGNISLNARDSITLDGLSRAGFASGIFSAVGGQNNFGRGGDIAIATSQLNVLNGAVIDASAGNFQSGGSITVRADRFNALNGGQIISTAIGAGRAGNIDLKISDQLVLAGRIDRRFDPLERDVINNDEPGASGLFANSLPNTTGDSGSISVSAKRMRLQDGARIAVNSEGQGTGGSIRIQGDQLTLSNQSLISAETLSTQGGNITLNLAERLLLRRNSLISTTAGIAQAAGNGGNIQLNSPLIVAIASENSDIAANAFTGRGGRIDVTAQGIFGIEAQARPTTRSDITATSQFGVSGTVTLNTIQVDPSRGLAELPLEPVDSANQIVQYCSPQAQATNSLTNIGRGGIPTNPSQPLTPDSTIVPWVTLDPSAPSTTIKPPDLPEPIVEAQSIGRDRTGKLALLPHASTAQIQLSNLARSNCIAKQ